MKEEKEFNWPDLLERLIMAGTTVNDTRYFNEFINLRLLDRHLDCRLLEMMSVRLSLCFTQTVDSAVAHNMKFYVALASWIARIMQERSWTRDDWRVVNNLAEAYIAEIQKEADE